MIRSCTFLFLTGLFFTLNGTAASKPASRKLVSKNAAQPPTKCVRSLSPSINAERALTKTASIVMRSSIQRDSLPVLLYWPLVVRSEPKSLDPLKADVQIEYIEEKRLKLIIQDDLSKMTLHQTITPPGQRSQRWLSRLTLKFVNPDAIGEWSQNRTSTQAKLFRVLFHYSDDVMDIQRRTGLYTARAQARDGRALICEKKFSPIAYRCFIEQ